MLLYHEINNELEKKTAKLIYHFCEEHPSYFKRVIDNVLCRVMADISIMTLPYPILTVSVLSRVTLVITITMGVVQAKMLYFISVFVLPWERELAPCPVCS